MGFIRSRVAAVSTYLAEIIRSGVPECVGSMEGEVLFIVDGVGGFQFAPALIRRAFRREDITLGTVAHKWQYGLPGEIWTDLMWLRRNRVMGVKLARKLAAHRRAHPQATIHVLAVSGGAGIAAFALERLRPIVETLVLTCPALSPQYRLTRALQAVQRCYAFVSHRDTGILGLGTRIFGTTDRKFCPAAGAVGFRIPADPTEEDVRAYGKLREIHWSPALKKAGHYGGHAGWFSSQLLCRHLLPVLRGEPLLPVHRVPPAREV